MPGSLARARKITRSGPHIGLKRPCRLSVAPDRLILPPSDRGPGDGTSQNHRSAVENAKKQDERPKISGITDELSECDKPQDESDKTTPNSTTTAIARAPLGRAAPIHPVATRSRLHNSSAYSCPQTNEIARPAANPIPRSARKLISKRRHTNHY